MIDGKDGGGAKTLSLVRNRTDETAIPTDRDEVISRRVIEILRTMLVGLRRPGPNTWRGRAS